MQVSQLDVCGWVGVRLAQADRDDTTSYLQCLMQCVCKLGMLNGSYMPPKRVVAKRLPGMMSASARRLTTRRAYSPAHALTLTPTPNTQAQHQSTPFHPPSPRRKTMRPAALTPTARGLPIPCHPQRLDARHSRGASGKDHHSPAVAYVFLRSQASRQVGRQ